MHQLSLNTDRIIRKEACSLNPVDDLDDDEDTLVTAVSASEAQPCPPSLGLIFSVELSSFELNSGPAASASEDISICEGRSAKSRGSVEGARMVGDIG